MNKCLICGKSLPSKRGLANHIRTHGITPSAYNKQFEEELNSGLIEGKDFLVCPICNKKVGFLRSHLRRTHNLSYQEIDELSVKSSADNYHERMSSAIKLSWEDKDRDFIGSKISETKSSRWTPEDTKRLYEARLASGCYTAIGKKRNQHLVEKYDSYEDYLKDISSRLSGKRATRIFSEDSYRPVMYRSSYEFKLSKLLNELGFEYKYESLWIDYYDPERKKNRKYNPDFFIPSLNLVLEVKPLIFIDNEVVLAKKQAVLNEGYRFNFITENELNIDSLKLIVI